MHFRPIWFQVAVLTAACGLGSCFGRISSTHRLFKKKKKKEGFLMLVVILNKTFVGLFVSHFLHY